MAEEQGFAGADESFANGEDTMPQVGMISQYVKDLSFENPNAPAVYQWQAQPSIDVQFNIGAATVGDDVHEVALKMEVTASADGNTAFAVELLYAGLFAIRNVPAEQLQPFLLAEAPRLLFPFARRVVADAIRDGGFPPLVLDPIDFGALYMERAAQVQAEATGAQASLETGDA
ncbi:MAG TPA: protein-export chaperone SecB [Allosphingosinicella sp.]|jgi:preprotein translocase subunit SecB